MASPIKVLLVDDSPIALKLLGDLLRSSSGIDVVGEFKDGQQALTKIPTLNPDVICTDYYMQGMNGLEFTQHVMSSNPKPILVVSISARTQACRNTVKLLNAGAVDIWPKPASEKTSDYERTKAELLGKIKILSGVKVFRRPLKRPKESLPTPQTAPLPSVASAPSISPVVQTPSPFLSPPQTYKGNYRIIAIGASTGGPQALSTILSKIPRNIPVPIVCVQHIGAGFLQGLVDCMRQECRLHIKIAEHNELPLPGVVYFAPEKFHLHLDSEGRFNYGKGAKGDIHCPSVNSMFDSIARFYGGSTLGILLTGMGRDGAMGMKTIADIGGCTIAQDEPTSIVFGMPAEAIAIGAAQHVIPLPDIAPFVLEQL